MSNIYASRLDEVVAARVAETTKQIEHSLNQIAAGNPLGAEFQEERQIERLQAKACVSRQQAEALAASIKSSAHTVESAAEAEHVPPPNGREAIWGSTLDFIGVNFFARGRLAANAVARVAFRDGRPQGTGFMVAPNLFLTNHHVIASTSDALRLCVEFEYETGPNGETLPVTRFTFDTQRCFVSDGIEGLDFTLIGVGERLYGERRLEDFGFIPLSDAGDKHMLGEVANIIQHPQGRLKEVVVRENQLVARDALNRVLHYVADTEGGASGSPVFNNQWEPIALHHWGTPWLEGKSEIGPSREVNEGIRISAIVKFLRRVAPTASGRTAESLRSALSVWEGSARVAEAAIPPRSEFSRTQRDEVIPDAPRIEPDGRVTWTIPIEFSLRLPGSFGGSRNSEAEPVQLTASTPVAPEAEARRRDEDFTDRGGYEPGFIPGFIVPLPKTAPDHTPAKNLQALPGEDPHELRYHHFSIVANAQRRLAYFTACNIDGSRVKAVNRKDKTVTAEPTLKQLGVESFEPEAADAFRPDPRLSTDEQMTKVFYDNQNVPGFPDKDSGERRARMFQKGHITLRGDPAWGTDDMAISAERDTFFYTNAAPQVGYFNQGSPLDRPGAKGKLRWRAVETFILRNAVTMRKRVTVLAGPIFADNDPEYRFGSRIPMKFWKIAVWADQDGLRSLALIADQAELLKVMPEGILSAEAFLDDTEILRVSEFLTTVKEIEAATSLDFGDAVRDADVRKDAERINVIDGETPETLRPIRRRISPAPTERRPSRARKSRTGQ